MLSQYLNNRDCDEKRFYQLIRQMIKKKVVTDNLLKKKFSPEEFLLSGA